MTVITTENKSENSFNQEKIETSTESQNIDSKVSKENQPSDKSNHSQQSEPEDTEKDPNWRAFREARKKDRAEREAAERRASEKEQEVAALKAAMEVAFSKNAPSPQAYQQYYGINNEASGEESEDQRIERIINQRLEKKEIENERKRQEREIQEYPMRLMKDFPDFNNVISQENRDYLDYHYPEISRPLGRLSDGYDKWSDIYHAIKKFVPNSNSAKKEALRADINSNKPKSMSSTGITQSQSIPGGHILSEEKKAANWERMRKSSKMVS